MKCNFYSLLLIFQEKNSMTDVRLEYLHEKHKIQGSNSGPRKDFSLEILIHIFLSYYSL